ncbi:hypothetical protein BDF22DRAFT_682582, partial [Syncephalis plumigaleata]
MQFKTTALIVAVVAIVSLQASVDAKDPPTLPKDLKEPKENHCGSGKDGCADGSPCKVLHYTYTPKDGVVKQADWYYCED